MDLCKSGTHVPLDAAPSTCREVLGLQGWACCRGGSGGGGVGSPGKGLGPVWRAENIPSRPQAQAHFHRGAQEGLSLPLAWATAVPLVESAPRM